MQASSSSTAVSVPRYLVECTPRSSLIDFPLIECSHPPPSSSSSSLKIPLYVWNLPIALASRIFIESGVPYLPALFNYPHPIPLAAFDYYKKNRFECVDESIKAFPKELLNRYYRSWDWLAGSEEKYNASYVKTPEFDTMAEYSRFKEEEAEKKKKKKSIKRSFQDMEGVDDLIECFEKKMKKDAEEAEEAEDNSNDEEQEY